MHKKRKSHGMLVVSVTVLGAPRGAAKPSGTFMAEKSGRIDQFVEYTGQERLRVPAFDDIASLVF